MKKLILLISSIIIIVILYFVLINTPKNYSIEYLLDNITISESFDKHNKVYSFLFADDNNSYHYSLPSKYLSSRRLIKKIIKEDDCYEFKTDSINIPNLCIKDNEVYTSYYDNKIEGNKKEKFSNIDIYDLNDKNYYIWQYNGFAYLSKKNNKNIKVFDQDVYNLDLITRFDDYLMMGNYNEKFMFTEFYMLNMNNQKISEFKVNRTIYLDSYFLGNYKKNVYLYDANSEVIYKIKPFDEEINVAKNQILKNNKWEDISINKLNKKIYVFENDQTFKYVVDNNKLLFETYNGHINITNLKVDRIVYQAGYDVYFICDNTLYYGNLNEGIKILLKYSEWTFNNSNIYIY